MKGMISKVQQAPEGAAPKAQDSALEQIIQGIEAKVQQAPPAIQQGYQSLVLAGMKLIYSQQTASTTLKYLASIPGPDQVPQYVSHGILQVLSLISKAVGPKLSMPAAALAVVTLMAMALDTLEKRQQMKVTPDMIAQTQQMMMRGFFKLFGITKDKIANAVNSAKPQGGKPGQPDQSVGNPGPPTQPIATAVGGA